MNWIIIIPLIITVLAVINLLIVSFNQQNLFFQSLYTFIYDHEKWKRYQKLKEHLKTNTIPFIHLMDYTDNADFAFVWYDDVIFIMQGNDIYLCSYFTRLIEDLLKRNKNDS